MQKKREKIRTGCLAGIVLLLLAAVCLLFWNLQSEESRNNEKSKEYIQNQAQTKAENEQEITEDREKEKDIEEQKAPEEPKDTEEQKDTEESKDIEEQKDTEEQFQKATDERNQEQSSEKKENDEKQQKITEERDAAQNIGKGERVELKEEEQKNAAEKSMEEADTAEKSTEEADAAERNTEEADAAEKNTEEADAAEKNTEEADAAEKNTEEAEQKNTEREWTVAIDPGHQGSWVDMSEKEPNGPGSTEMKAMATTGTQGKYSGKPEYELNLEVSLLLREELEKRGYRVILTREDNDKAISNAQRAEYAYEEGGDIYVRIHANGSDHSGVSGALAMVPSPSNLYVGELAEESYRLAEAILNAYCEKASFSSLGIQYYDNMTGINWSKLPVMILEMGFMTNQTDDLRMADPEIQRLMAEGIADGIDQYFTEATGIELEK